MGTALLDDGYPGHPKIVPLSDAAFRVHTTALCHVKRYRTGGFIAAGSEVSLHPRLTRKALASAIAELESGNGSPTAAPLWERLEDSSGWLIHDYESWHGEGPGDAAEARIELDAKRAELSRKRAEAGRRGGLRSAEQPRAGGRFAAEQEAPSKTEQEPSKPTEQNGSNAEQTATEQTEQTPHADARPYAHADPPARESPPSSPLVLTSSSLSKAEDPTCQVRSGRGKRRWRRVPAEWEPGPAHVALAKRLGVDLQFQLEKFRDHEFDKPKSDADAAFRNWLRSPLARSGGTGGRAFNRAEDTMQRQLEHIAELEALEAQGAEGAP